LIDGELAIFNILVYFLCKQLIILQEDIYMFLLSAQVRSRARDILKLQLDDFRAQRALGRLKKTLIQTRNDNTFYTLFYVISCV
jgi:hypothetical protein